MEMSSRVASRWFMFLYFLLHHMAQPGTDQHKDGSQLIDQFYRVPEG